MHTRRHFLTFCGTAATVSAVALHLSARQTAQAPPAGQLPSHKTHQDDDIPAAPATKGILDANEKDIKKKIERLYELAADLKEQVQKTDSSKVLSLSLVKKAEEIEKLARDIKTKAKG